MLKTRMYLTHKTEKSSGIHVSTESIEITESIKVKAALAAFCTSIPDQSLSASFPMTMLLPYSSLRPSVCKISQGLRGANLTNMVHLTRRLIADNDVVHTGFSKINCFDFK